MLWINTMKKLLFWGAFSSLLSITPVYAWGPLGHKAICDASWRLSQPPIQRLLGQAANRMGYNTFAEACVWADHIRGQQKHKWLAPLHYVNLPKKAKFTRGAPCLQLSPSQPACVLTAIEYFSQRLMDKGLAQGQRDAALLLVGHFVGDIHQPLHVSYTGDRGGTRYKVKFEGRDLSLHSLWDTGILTCGSRGPASASSSGSWSSMGESISMRIKQGERFNQGKQNSDLSVLSWANESLLMTRRIYSELATPLAKDYCGQFQPVAMLRLQLAAERLTALLEAKL
jgi:hypothetical protein